MSCTLDRRTRLHHQEELGASPKQGAPCSHRETQAPREVHPEMQSYRVQASAPVTPQSTLGCGVTSLLGHHSLPRPAQ